MGELMNAVIKYAESDKPKDADSEDDKAGQNKKNGGKGSQNQPNKRHHDQNASDLVANTNIGYQRQKQGGSNYRKTEGGGYRPNIFEAAMQGPCPTHSIPGRPANHTWEQCDFMKEFARRENQVPPGSAGGVGQGSHNQNSDHHGADTTHLQQGPGGGGQQGQSGSSGFQANPKQLQNRSAFHVFTTSSCRRDKKLQQRAAMAVATEPACPRWLNWSKQPIT